LIFAYGIKRESILTIIYIEYMDDPWFPLVASGTWVHWSRIVEKIRVLVDEQMG
jgi:hypothetical protein